MKRNRMVILLLAFAAALVISGCGKAGTSRTSAYTVTFYDSGEVIGASTVHAGATVEDIPADVLLWQDEAGCFVDVAGVEVSEDRSFYAWHAPALREGQEVLIDAPGERFYPNHILSRGEAALIAYALLAEDAVGADAPDLAFTDVAENSPEREAIRAVCALGVMSGYEDGRFRPREEMKKADFAAVLYRLAGMPGAEEAGVSGAPNRVWTAASIACAQERGWVPDGEFVPSEKLTRAEAAVMASRFRGEPIEPADIDLACPVSPFVDVSRDDEAYYEIIDVAYRNDLLSLITGTMTGSEPGVQLLEDRLCHVNAETLRLDRYEAGFVTIDGQLYHVSEDGFFIDRLPAGLIELDGGMYYVPEDDGPFMTDDDLGYLHFGPDGKYTSGSAAVDEYVDELLKDILTDDSLSKRDKLYRAYCAIRDGGFFYRSRPNGWNRGTDSWALGCAEVMYREKYGSCYYWAAAFLYTARRVGYQAYPVCGGVGTRNQIHAWVVVIDDDEQEYICDVELDWAYRRGFYDGMYAPTDMFMQPIYATKVIYVFPGQQPTFYSYYGVSWEESDEEVVVVPPEEDIDPEAMENQGGEVDPEAVEGQETEGEPGDAEQTAESEQTAPETVPADEEAAETADAPAETAPADTVSEPESEPAPEPEPEPATEPEAEPAPAPEPEPAPAPEPAAEPAPEPAVEGEGE